jgi:DNA helicase HerA-like ATPase
MISALTPDYEVEELSHLIVIDEAHWILEKAREQFTNSDFYIAKEQLETIFNRLLREFRSKGLGFIISDVTPSDLFHAATKLPSVKILFRMGEECIRRFTSMEEYLRYLLLLENRQALVLNGNNTERYSIQTITVSTKKVPPKSLQHT